MPDYLVPKEIKELIPVAVRNGMGNASVRDLLFAFVDFDYYTRLPIHPNPRDQVQSDLIRMSRTSFLRHYEVPLLLWLEQAVQRLQSGNFADLRLFEKAREKVALESQRRIAADQEQPETPSTVTGELELSVERGFVEQRSPLSPPADGIRLTYIVSVGRRAAHRLVLGAGRTVHDGRQAI